MIKKALLKNSPEKALHQVNEELFHDGKNNTPLKVFLGVFNLRSGVCQIFNAGHVDPVIKSKNGNTGFITGPFIPFLGASSDSTFIPMPLQLNAGDNLYFYSNETIEAANGNGEKYGRERLMNVLSLSGNNAQEVIKSISSDLADFTGKASLDADIAIAVLEYTPTTFQG